mgnify:CR=1 FL=1
MNRLAAEFGQAATQTLTARVPLANDDRRWTPGLFVNGAVALSETAVLAFEYGFSTVATDALTLCSAAPLSYGTWDA